MVCLQQAALEEEFLEPILCGWDVKKTIVKWLNESAITAAKFKLQKRVDCARDRYFNVAEDSASPDLGAEMPSVQPPIIGRFYRFRD